MAHAQKYSTLRIYIPQKEVVVLKEHGMEFDHGEFDFEKQTFINSFSSQDIEILKSLGYKYDVLVEDEMEEFLKKNKTGDFFAKDHLAVQSRAQFSFQANCKSYESFITTPSAFQSGSRAGFYTLTELENIYNNMVSGYPGLVRKFSIGTTVEGRTIWALKISDNPDLDENEPEVLYTGLHHSREGMSMMNIIYFMQYILENYSTNKQVEELLNARELFFVPCVNVDGYNYNTTAANWTANRRMRRKNMRATGGTQNTDGSGGKGVDLNRNYSKYWGLNNTGSSGTVTSDAYRGPSAFSEPETQAIRAFVNSRKFTMAINYHCYGNWWIRPNGPATASTLLPAEDVKVFGGLANMLTKYNGYVYGTASETVYEVNGYSDDWFFSEDLHLRSKVYAFSPEIGTLSEGGFWAYTENIIPLAKKQLFANLQMAYAGGSYADIVDTTDVSVSSTSGNFRYIVTRRGLTDAPIRVTLIPLQNIKTVGSYVDIPSIPVYLGTAAGSVSYTLPSNLPSGSYIKYVWQMETGGMTFKDTITKLYKPQVVFTDNMETTESFASLWQNVGTGSSWNYSDISAVSGTRSLSESPTSNYASSANHFIRTKNSLDLTAGTTAYLSYMIKYSSENHQDRLSVEFSTTGTAGTFIPICTPNTIKESSYSMGNIPAYTGGSDGWIREIIDISQFTGNNNVSFGFRFRSNTTTIKDGFYIDDVKLVMSNASILPVEFLDIKANQQINGVNILWKAEVDNKFSFYEVQRSANGIDFVTIGVKEHTTLNNYLDVNPISGTSFYRIRAVNIDGGLKYSSVVSVVIKNIITVNSYPNPFSSSLHVDIVRQEAGSVKIELTSLTGQVVYSGIKWLHPGNNNVSIDVTPLSNQMYTLTIKDMKNQVINTSKVIKQ